MQDTARTPNPTPSADELENYRRLVHLQAQIVELARRNSESERLCRLLRKRLDHQSALRNRRGPRRLLSRLLQRIRTTHLFDRPSPRVDRRLNGSTGTAARGLDPSSLESI